MLSFPSLVSGLMLLVSSIHALTITEPSDSTVINPQQPFTIRWTSAAGDPSTLTFTIAGAGDFSIAQYQEIATNVQTSAGSVEVPANTVGNFGQYKIEARDASTSSVLTTSANFYLAQGDGQTMSISSNGGATGDPFNFGTTRTPNPQVSTVTGTDGTSVILSGTVTPTLTSTTSPATSATSTSGAASSTASPTQTPNAQMRLGADNNAMILSMAGMIAGVVALVA